MRNVLDTVVEIVRIWGCLLAGMDISPTEEWSIPMRNASARVIENISHLGMLTPAGWTSHQPRSVEHPLCGTPWTRVIEIIRIWGC